jgi:hypothetical protein
VSVRAGRVIGIALLAVSSGWSAPLEIENGIPYVQGRIHCQGVTEEGWFVVDTGTQETLLYSVPSLLPHATPASGPPLFAVGMDSSKEALKIGLDRLEFGDQSFDKAEVLIFKDWFPRGHRRVLGVIGLDLLSKSSFILSILGKDFEPGAPSNLDEWTKCPDFGPFSEDHPHWTLHSKYGIYDIDFIFDTGAFLNLDPYAETTSHDHPKNWVGTFDVRSPPYLVGLESMPVIEGRDFGLGFALKGFNVNNFTLGTQVLAAWDWYYDQPSQSLYRRPASDLQYSAFRKQGNHTRASDSLGFTLDLNSHQVVTVYKWGNPFKPILPQVAVGDTLISIDDVPVETIASLGSALNAIKSGKLKFKRQDSFFEVEINRDELNVDYAGLLSDF